MLPTILKIIFLAEREDRQCSKIEWFVVALFSHNNNNKTSNAYSQQS